MKVFKFGGPSIVGIDRIKNVAHILQQNNNQPLMVIISAMGKTTNALEKITDAFFEGRNEEALQLFGLLKKQHLTTAKYLLVKSFNSCIEQLNDFFTEAEWLLHDTPVREYDYYYDQLVCIGELLSTAIVSHYLNEEGILNEWIDARDIVRTDNHFHEANVDFTITNEKMQQLVVPALGKQYINDKQQPVYGICITQGFIGATDENECTTLGREGSDYTAAIFTNLLNAESLTIWKDVEGIMNADPKQFAQAELIPELNYEEVIEMAYYGAQVVHPKTIKPLQNKEIPLYVRPFTNLVSTGTIIHKKRIKNLPPIIVYKENQVLLHLLSKDFSFVEEKPIARLYELLNQLNIKPNLVQTDAVRVLICLDDNEYKIGRLAEKANDLFDVQVEKGLTLLTLRHYNEAIYTSLIQGKEPVLLQSTETTVQALYK